MKSLLQLASEGIANVLISGPTGSGKSSLAKTIHEGSGRRRGPFVAVNLATLHEGTFESELFGHEKGAFTGADQRRIGRLESSQGGTVFLDEVAELSPRLQARLLEFLQSRVIAPVGSNREIRLDVRVIAATNRDLSLLVSKNEFREDLFHRLRVISIELRSLSERSDEFDMLVHACLNDVCKIYGKSVLKISEEVALLLEQHTWPGNLRELRNVLEYAVLASEGGEIQAQDLPGWFFDQLNSKKSRETASNPDLLASARKFSKLDYNSAIAVFEKSYLEGALSRYRGRINYTARQIGINKTTLIRRMRTYGINPEFSEKQIHNTVRN